MQQQAEIFMRTELNAKNIRQKTLLLHIILQKRFQKFQSFFGYKYNFLLNYHPG